MFNKLILLGNLTRDIEIRNIPSGLAISNTGIATNRKYTSQTGEEKEEVMFIDITFFGKTAEVAQKYLKKGSKILVDGRLKLDQWTDTNGQKRSKHSLVVESMKMLGREEGSELPIGKSVEISSEQQSGIIKPDVRISFDESQIPF